MGDELLLALFSAVTEAVFSYAFEQGRIGDRLREWVKRDPTKLAYQKGLARTYSAFARQYPELAASLFDQSFLAHEAVPELSKLLTRHEHPDPAQLALLWITSFVPKTKAERASIERWNRDLHVVNASAQFLLWLEAELKAEPVFQPLFDSRALESLPNIVANLDRLNRALQQALDIAAHYQQFVVTQSGGIDFTAHDVDIGGDAVGRDKMVSNVYNSYFYGGFETLDDLYVRPDAVFQRVSIQDFVGREWLTAKVDAFLNDPKRKSGAFLLVGAAGVGKTSFLANLVNERRYLHLFAEQVPGEVNLSRALQSLGAQLVARYAIDPYKDRNTLPAIATFPDFLDRLLRLAIRNLAADEKIVIVCDALDEAGTAPNGNVFGLPSVLPDGVYLILSQRPVLTRLHIDTGVLTEKIEATGTDNLHDVEQYLMTTAYRSEIAGQLRAHGHSEADFVRMLTEKSSGVWMYLHYVIAEMTIGSRVPLDLRKLPSGLVGYYTEYWEDWAEGRNGVDNDPARWNLVYAPILATLAAAQTPITSMLIRTWSHVPITDYEIERLLRRWWGAFVTERDINHKPHFSIYHTK